MDAKTLYITTPLYYVNDVPHIGHAYTTIAADILARWGRMNGRDVFFLTGTDEHGAKIEKAAQDAGQTPAEFVTRIAGAFRDMWGILGITHDDFIQTSQDRHKTVVQAVFEKLKADGHIYKGSYEDWYCLHDESYFSEAELGEGKKCPQCGREVQKLKEESYFFRLSAFEQRLLDHYAAHPGFLSPKHRANEITNFVKSGLKDLSVSRTRVKWGVPVTSDPAHTVYVWFDALLNYISAPGYAPAGDSAAFSKRWPADVHLVGKEIYRFHTVIWPAMLMALGLPLPTKVFAHGWWTVDGTKMSKSLGNVVDPKAMADEYGADAFRYFLFREVPFGSDGDFSEKALLGRYNAELANNVGNLMQRTLTLLHKHFAGVVPAGAAPTAIVGDTAGIVKAVDAAHDALAYGDALDAAYAVVLKANKFIDDRAPWKLGEAQKDEIAVILRECLAAVKVVAVILHPFMPAKTQQMWAALGEPGELSAQAGSNLSAWRGGKPVDFAAGQQTVKGDPLFMRKGGRWK